MADENNRKINKDPFFSNYVSKVASSVKSEDISEEKKAILTHYVSVWADIRDQIKKIADGDLDECSRIIRMGYGQNSPDFEKQPIKGDPDYIKFQLGVAMMACDSGITWAMDGEMMRALDYLLFSKSILDSTLECDDNTERLKTLLDRYQHGPKTKSMLSEHKWDIARKYFLEEIPRNKTLKKAREIAAARAGINVEERQLIKKLPKPK